MEVMLGVFFINGGRHLIDIGVCGESVAEFHAIMPSAPSCCDSKWHDDKRQARKCDEEGFPFPLVQLHDRENEPDDRQWNNQQQAVFIDEIEYFEAGGNFHGFSSAGKAG